MSKRKLTESEVETKTAKYAKEKGFLTYKFWPHYQRGVPDRIFVKLGFIFFVEFKKPGEQPRALQKAIIDQLRGQRCQVFVIDSIQAGQILIDEIDKKLCTSNVK